MLSRTILILFGAIMLTIIPAQAQDPARDVQDLVGARASSGESQLRSRGYVFVKNTRGDDRIWSNWWNNRRNQCITVVTMDGRYNSLVTSPAFDCNRSGNNNGGSNSRENAPSWAQGTWYWTGGDRVMTINRNGSVSVRIDGSTYDGYYSGGRIYLNNDVSTITRNGNQIRTYNQNTRETSYYSRNSSGGGPVFGGGGSAQNAPSWARGTWYWTGGDRVMTIANNGGVTVRIGGSTYDGYYRAGRLYINNDESTITRNGNQIRTYNQSTGETSYYSRSPSGGAGPGWGNSDKVNLDDLVGVRASSGGAQMRARGFRNVDGFKSGNTSYTIWWRARSSQCIQVATADGRYDSVKDIQTHPRCN